MNKAVMDNYTKLRLVQLFPPLILLFSITLYLYKENALNKESYIEIQTELFLVLNSILSQLPEIQNNLTQFGDAFIFLSLITIFIIYIPKIWEAILSASLVSVFFCKLSKQIFSVPRPAAVLDQDSFVIIGKTLTGSNSLPSGHSMTVFTILTILLYSFMPKKIKYKTIWVFVVLVIGIILVFTRVGVGAHYPIDVIAGSTIGYISGLLGIFISRRYKIWSWIYNKKSYPLFILLFILGIAILINKISKESLIIYYFTMISLIISIYKMIQAYVKE